MFAHLAALIPTPTPSPISPDSPPEIPVNGLTVGILAATAIMIFAAWLSGFLGDQSKGNWK